MFLHLTNLPRQLSTRPSNAVNQNPIELLYTAVAQMQKQHFATVMYCSTAARSQHTFTYLQLQRKCRRANGNDRPHMFVLFCFIHSLKAYHKSIRTSKVKNTLIYLSQEWYNFSPCGRNPYLHNATNRNPHKPAVGRITTAYPRHRALSFAAPWRTAISLSLATGGFSVLNHVIKTTSCRNLLSHVLPTTRPFPYSVRDRTWRIECAPLKKRDTYFLCSPASLSPVPSMLHPPATTLHPTCK